MKIAVIGTGYIGLVSGVCLAKIGHDVTCVDKDAGKIAQLKFGEVPIYEPGLSALMAEMVAAGHLHFATDVVQASKTCDAIFIAVGTPPSADGATPDLTAVFDVTSQIASGLDGFKLIVVKSTVPVGTGQKLEDLLRGLAPRADFEVVSNPEFLREGAAIFDFLSPDRIVIGCKSQRGQDMMSRIYASFIAAQVPIVSTDIESAEIIKFASNGLLATKVAFINEIAQLCEKTTANVNDVARGMGLDPRIGAKFLQAGPGFGGSCFPKDSRALVAMAEAHGVDMQITRAVVASNETTKGHMVAKILELVDNEIAGKTILVLGVTFKPDTDDMREAPALDILPPLVDGGAVLHIVDPEGRKNGEAAFPAAVWFEDAYAAAEQADIVVVLTEWQTFRQLDLMRLRDHMRGSAIADLRNIYPPEALKQAGFTRIAQVGVAMV